MISGWSKLQVPLGSESQGWGSFTLSSASIVSRSLGKEQNFFLCRSYGDKGGLEPHNDSIFFRVPKTRLVENLVGALINAAEILDGYAHPSCVSAAFNGFLGFEAFSQDHKFSLAHALQHGEPLQLLSHERLSHGSSSDDLTSLVGRNVPHVSMRLSSNSSNAHALRSVQPSSSSALHSQNMSDGHRDPSVNTICAGDHGQSRHSHLPASSEEDILLQEARFKASRIQSEGDEWKRLRQASASSEGLMEIVNAQLKQAKDLREPKSHISLEGHAESGKSWLFAEFVALSRESSLFWGGIALSMFLVGAVFVTCKSSFFTQGRFKRPSVKRRILKSQWYGNPGSQSWGHRNFQMRISEFPKYPILEIDGDKKQLRFPDNNGVNLAGFARSGSDPARIANATHGHPANKTTDGKPDTQISTSRMPNRQPIRQTVRGSKALPGQQHVPRRAQPYRALHGKALSHDVEGSSQSSLSNDRLERQEETKDAEFSLPRGWPAKSRINGKVRSSEEFPVGGLHGRRVSESVQKYDSIHRTSKMVASKSRTTQRHWGKDDEVDLDQRIQKLYETIQAVEQHRRAAMLALEEERQRSMVLQEEMVKQREASAVLGEEVRLLKESHNALLASLRKKYSTSAAARTAADLVYQDWERHAAVE